MNRRILALSALILMTAACRRNAQQYIEAGNKAFEKGLFDDAAIQYENAIRRDPNSGAAYRGVAVTALRQDKSAVAYQALSRAMTLMPENEAVQAQFGDLCLAAYLSSTRRPQYLYDNIGKVAEQLLARNPASFDGLRLKAQLALTDRKPTIAVELFRKADAVQPMHPLVSVGLTQSLIQNDQVAEAEAYAAQVIGKRKDFTPIYDLLYVHYLSSHRLEDAEKLLRSKVENNPKNTGAWIQLISHCHATGRKPEAERMTAKLLEAPGEYPGLRRQLGDYFAGQGDPARAIGQFELGAAEDPKEKLALLKRAAATLFAAGRKDEASATVDEVIKASPGDKDALQLRAQMRLEAGDPAKLKEAVSELAEVAKRYPGDADLQFNLGRLLLSVGNLEAARSALTEAVRRRPSFTAAQLLLSETYLRMQRAKEAGQQADEVLRGDPRHRTARLLHAMAQMAQQQVVEARTELNRLIKDEPQLLDAQLQLGLLSVTEKKYREADEIFRRFYKPGQGDLRPLEGLVASQVARSQFDQAMQLLSEESKGAGNSAGVRAVYAATAVRAGKYDLALGEYQKLAAESPKSGDLLTRISEVHQLRGDLPAAVGAAKKAFDLAPASPLAAAFLAQMLDSAGQKSEAAAQYRRSLQMKPDDPEILNNLAFLLAETGKDLDEAMNLALRAQRFSPESPAVADTIGFVYLKKGMNDPALQIFRNLAKRFPDQSVFHYRLGVALIAKGDRAKAQEELQRALSTGPSKSDEAQIRELLRRAG